MPKAKKSKKSSAKKRQARTLLTWTIGLGGRESSYYLAWFGVCLVIAGMFVFFWHNFLAALTLVALAVIYVWFNIRLAEVHKVEIVKQGIIYDGHLYPFKELLGYSVVSRLKEEIIVLRTTYRLLPEIRIVVPRSKLDKAKRILARFLPSQPKM